VTALESFLTASRRSGLLLDANVLTLLIVGRVNRARIAEFKRTRRYDIHAFNLLLHLLRQASPREIFALPQVLAETSNLTDLKGKELLAARLALRDGIRQSHELQIPSLKAADHPAYSRLGLTDAAISIAALENGFAVLTDDLNLYLTLSEQGTSVLNFTHLRQLRMFGTLGTVLG
jgi:predicted nucleic acid-binding protein